MSLVLFASLPLSVAAEEASKAAPDKPDKIVGMYVHQHWAYHHPYAARTWTLEDWSGYADGLQKLGYNTIKIWPMLETMPDPLTESDVANLEKLRQAIDVIHAKGLRVIIALCPNVAADNAVAGQMKFEERVFFYCDLRVNPADADAVQKLVAWRAKLFKPLAKADAVAIIDSDPAGYPGSNNQEFIDLLVAHRKMFDRLRPGIELLYWIHAGWPGYCRYYETGEFAMSEESEYLDALDRLKKANPEPWGLAGNIHYAKLTGLTDRAIDYRYGSVEAEPSFPLTNFGSDRAYLAAQNAEGRGVMANAQSHCLQLPNTFAFAQGALGRPLQEADYVEFANQLIPGHGAEIVAGWTALASSDPQQMRKTVEELNRLAGLELRTGSLKGLLFGDPKRFLTDIVMQLRLQAAYEDFCDASEQGADVGAKFGEFVRRFAEWQQHHGYSGRAVWIWPRLNAALDKLHSPEIDAVLHASLQAKAPFARLKEEYYIAESATARLVDAMKATAQRVSPEARAAAP